MRRVSGKTRIWQIFIQNKAMKRYKDPQITRGAIIFDLHTPIFGSEFSIWEKWLRIAKERRLRLVVKTPFGTATYPSYKEWVLGARVIKKPHHFPNRPMRMYARHILTDIQKRYKRKYQEEKMSVIGLFSRLPLERVKKLKREVFGK